MDNSTRVRQTMEEIADHIESKFNGKRPWIQVMSFSGVYAQLNQQFHLDVLDTYFTIGYHGGSGTEQLPIIIVGLGKDKYKIFSVDINNLEFSLEQVKDRASKYVDELCRF